MIEIPQRVVWALIIAVIVLVAFSYCQLGVTL
jgi:hypothetical protein